MAKADNETVHISCASGTGPLLIRWTSDATCRVLECPWFLDEFGYDDEIEIARSPDTATLQFLRLVRPSPLVRTTLVLDAATASSPKFDALADAVDAVGGYWERAFGGAAFVALPPGSGVDAEAILGT